MDAEDLEKDFALSGNVSTLDTSLSSIVSKPYTRRNVSSSTFDTSDSIKGNFIICIAFKIQHLHFYYF
jgi:hypothetical protein